MCASLFCLPLLATDEDEQAPVSLVNSLEEYLNDPNFEKNREEYKENKRVADGGTARGEPLTHSVETLLTMSSQNAHACDQLGR